MKTFTEVLKSHGFKKFDKNSFNNEPKGWYAEILTSGKSEYVWMVGKGLKSISSFPGGYTYWNPELVNEELVKQKL